MSNVSGISIVIPTYNRDVVLQRTLTSISKLAVPAGVEIEVLIIDNNCSDNTTGVVAEAARTARFPIRSIVERSQGLCYGRNRGLREASYEDVVYLDDDVRIDRGWLLGYVAAVEQMAADCVVGPVFPEFEGEVPHYVSERVLDSVTSAYSRKGERAMVLPSEVAHQLPGCNFGIRKSTAVEVGGFDNTLDRVGRGALAGGDTEFGHRLVGSHRRVTYHPDCAIRHFISEGKLSPQSLRERWSGLGRTQWILYKKSRLGFWPALGHAGGVLKLFGASVTQYLRGNTRVAFQCELECRRSLGYLHASGLRGKCLARSALAFLTFVSRLR